MHLDTYVANLFLFEGEKEIIIAGSLSLIESYEVKPKKLLLL